MQYKHIVRLEDADNAALFGGKAASLCAAVRNRLPVPNGVVIPFPIVLECINSRLSLRTEFEAILNELGGHAAVRSSAISEDGREISFAGQYISVLNVTTAEDMEKSVAAVWESACSKRVMAYKEKLGIACPNSDVSISILIQQMIPSDVAGILFSKNPVTGMDERVIEASWGLGEAVASGYINPDYFRLARDGTLLEYNIRAKPMAFHCMASGGIAELKLSDRLAHLACLSELELSKLNKLTDACERIFGMEIDMEWAFYRKKLYLLQCRSITGQHVRWS